MEQIIIGPQEGPQTVFLKCEADIALYGGAAGGGKSFGLLLDPVRHYHNPEFGGVIFRRTTPEIRNEGGLWDESMKLYGMIGGQPHESVLEWDFPSGMRMKFAHMEHEKDRLKWQGAQLAFIGFDELTHFTRKQFMYMLSRNRSTSGVIPYIRATTNPDYDSWVRKVIDWWIGPDGLPIPERSGVLRWFVTVDDDFVWADTKEELLAIYPDLPPLSFTFIAANVYDNKILLEKDPTYLAKLKALSRVDRLRLEGGNWNVRANAGTLFRREWFKVIPAIQNAQVLKSVRYWDRAATEPNASNPDPDFTAGLKMVKLSSGIFVVTSVIRGQWRPLAVEQTLANIASQDGRSTSIFIEQEPGASGVADAERQVRLLAGYDARVRKPAVDKVTRAKPVSAQAEIGNIWVLEGPWNEAFFRELENFAEDMDHGHDDQVDAFSGAFNELAGPVSGFDVL